MRTESSNYDVIMKVVVIGDSNVGKTNLLSRYIRNEFKLESRSTIGVEFSTCFHKIESKNVKVQLWDTAGEEKFRAVARQYYRNACAALLVYDTTSMLSFEHCSQWLEECKSFGETDVYVLLVGNKADLRHLQSVPSAQARRFADLHQLRFMETSALANTNVENAFSELIKGGFQVLKSSGQLEQQSLSGSTILKGADPVEENEIVCCGK